MERVMLRAARRLGFHATQETRGDASSQRKPAPGSGVPSPMRPIETPSPHANQEYSATAIFRVLFLAPKKRCEVFISFLLY